MSQPVSWVSGGGRLLGLRDIKPQDLLSLAEKFDCKALRGTCE
jgi:hypothetical protein